MIRTLRMAATAFALFAGISTASAGPIEWSYSAHVRTSAGTGVLKIGSYQLLYDPSGNGTSEPISGNYTLTVPFAERTIAGTSADATGVNSDTIAPFSVGHGYSLVPTANAPPSDTTFLVDLTITDSASGQSGTVSLTGSAGASTWETFPTPALFSLSMNPDQSDLVLGSNRYRVAALGGLPDELDEPAAASFRITATADTPEPGTLLLAAVGLSGVGFGWVRRRV